MDRKKGNEPEWGEIAWNDAGMNRNITEMDQNKPEWDPSSSDESIQMQTVSASCHFKKGDGDAGTRGRGDVEHEDMSFSFPFWTVKYKKTLYLGELWRLHKEENSPRILLFAVRWMLSQRRGFSWSKKKTNLWVTIIPYCEPRYNDPLYNDIPRHN